MQLHPPGCRHPFIQNFLIQGMHKTILRGQRPIRPFLYPLCLDEVPVASQLLTLFLDRHGLFFHARRHGSR